MSRYTTDMLLNAAKQAEASGDIDSARTLYTQARDQGFAEAEQTERGMYTMPSAIRQTLQGPTLGFADEAEAALRAPFSEQTYGDIHADLAQTREAYSAANPKAALAQEMAGGMALPTGVPAAAARYAPAAASAFLRAGQSIPTAAKAPLAGGSIAGVYGAGTADPGERMVGSLDDAAIGAVTGGAGRYFIDKIGAPLFGRLMRNLASTERGDARRLLLRALEDSGMSPEQALGELDRMGPDAVLADLSPALRQLGIDATSIPGSTARNTAESVLLPRAAAQQKVLWDTVNEVMGQPPGVKMSLDAIEASQRRAAGPMYDAAYDAVIEPTEDLLSLLEVPDVKKAYKSGQRLAQLELGAPIKAKALVDDEWVEFPDMREWDLIQRGLRARAEGARIKNPTLARALYGARGEMLSIIDDINPEFAAARNTYAKHEALKDAMGAGEKFLKEDEELLEEFISGLTDSEKQAYMIGVAKTIRREIMGMGKNRDASLNKIFNVPLYQEKLTSVLGTDRAGQVLQMAEDLGRMQATKNKTLSRSPTADILAGQQRMQGPRSVGDLTAQAVDAVFGNPELSARNANYLGDMMYGRPGSPAAMQPTLGGGLLQVPQNIGEVTPFAYGLLGGQTYNTLGDEQ